MFVIARIGRVGRPGWSANAGARRRPGADPVRARCGGRHPRQASRPGRGGRGPDAAHGGHRGPAAGPGSGDRRLAVRAPPGRGGRGAGVQPAQRAHRHGHRAGRCGGRAVRGAPRPAGRAAHAERGQGRGDRERAGGQGPGHHHGDAAAPAGRPAEARGHGRRPGPGHLPPVARPPDPARRASPGGGPPGPPERRRAPSGAAASPGGRPPGPPARRCAPRGGTPPRQHLYVDGPGRTTEILHLDGLVCAIAPEGAVIEVGGVGLLVQATPGTLAGLRTGERARVATSLVVREDALTLYGFVSDDERDVFELVQTCSGVGPRLALAMLASFSPDGLRQAIASEDVAALTRVPGIGRKGAQRIVLELAGRLGSPAAPAGVLGPPPGAGHAAGAAALWRDQVRAGLVNLGWSARDAEEAIAAVAADLAAGTDGTGGPDGAAVDVSVALRAALRKLSRT